ncbi:MAG: hypothetical protein LBO67_00500 [Spirochaetaceae bacterium]|nr:hypothetical protein [Spirochaetaceae bacterium]
MRKKFLFSVIALLSASLVFMSCPPEAKTDDDPTKVTGGAIAGVTQPATSGTPVTSITATEYTGTITWSPAVSDTFAASTVYTATITLTPEAGYTFAGFSGTDDDVFSVADATVTQTAGTDSNAGKWIVTAIFPVTAAAPAPIASGAITGLVAPIFGNTVPAANIVTATPAGTSVAVEWKPVSGTSLGAALAVDTPFAASTTYVATITLTASGENTFAADAAFTGITGADTTKNGTAVVTGINFTSGIEQKLGSPANKWVISVIFPATSSSEIAGGEITGLVAPVAGTTALAAGDLVPPAHTSVAIEWKPVSGTSLETALTPGTSFAEDKVYVAIITLTPEDGYTFASTAAFTLANTSGADTTKNGTAVVTGINFTSGIEQSTAGTSPYVIKAIFPKTLAAFSPSAITITEGQDKLSIAITPTDALKTAGVKVYVKNDGSAVTLSTASSLAEFTELTETDRVDATTTPGTVVLTLAKGATTGSVAEADRGKQLKTGSLTVTIAANAQTKQVTAATPVASKTGAQTLAESLSGATVTTDNLTGTVTLGANFSLTAALEVPVDITLAVSTHTLTVGTYTLTVAAGGSVTVAAGGSVTAGKLVLGEGTWTATTAGATIAADTLTLGENAKFGADDGTAATVLTGTTAATNTFTASDSASGSVTTTLSQSTNDLVIEGGATTAVLTTGATAGITVTAGLEIKDVTLDISASTATAGGITLADDSTGIKFLTATNSIIKLGSGATASTQPVAGLEITINDVTVNATTGGATASDPIGTFVASAANGTIVENASGAKLYGGITTDAAAQ